MKLWKRWTAAVLTAAMTLVLLAACGPSGPSVPDQPGTPANPGTAEPGKDPAAEPGTGENGGGTAQKPDDETAQAKKTAATVAALDAVRKEYGQTTQLELNAEACARAAEMAKLQLDGINGVYGSSQMDSEEYTAEWNRICRTQVAGKKAVGVGGYGAYPDQSVFRTWAGDAGKWKPALVKSSETTLVGVGVVQNTNPATSKEWPYMVVVMTY